jgi:hypothetical protein
MRIHRRIRDLHRTPGDFAVVDGRQIAFVSRRRGWSQVWLVDAPVPRRGRPARDPKPPEPVPLTSTGVDIEDYVWLPDDRTLIEHIVFWITLPLGLFAIVENGFLRGTRGPNRYGPEPSAQHA